MKPFKHINATSLEQATAGLQAGNASLNGGGTDLLGTLKDNLLPEYPETVINLKTIPGLDYVTEENGTLRIGALTRLSDIAENPLVKGKYTALAEAARAVATPHIRDMGTLGGTLAQLPRCWYFRKQENRFNCLRKGGNECFAILGDHRYHSAFGGAKICATPCTRQCPAGTDIPGYFEKLRAGDWDGAAGIIMQVNPMPMLTGRVCAHFCQTGCNRNATDESVYVHSVERTLGDYILDNSDKFYAPPETSTGKSTAVVGSGPAGLSAAYYLRKAGHQVTVYDGKEEAGGMLRYAIPAYRLPRDTVRRYIKALEHMGIVFKLGQKLGETVMPEELERTYDSVLYATGTWKRPVMGLSGEDMTVFGLDFLVEVEAWMSGKLGSDVFVMGGGNVAMDVAITAKRLGAKKVTLACLEPRHKMPASAEEIARAEEEGVVIMPSWGLSRVVEENGIVKGMELKSCTSVWDEDGVFNPQYDACTTIVIEAENILMAVGQKVDLSFLDEKYQLQLSRRGLIDVAEDTKMTSRKGIFAAGDATTGPGTAIGAITTGRKASMGMNAYLGAAPTPTAAGTKSKALTFDAQGVQVKTPIKLRELGVDARRVDLEDSMTPSQQEAISETLRCMNCGCHAVHPSDVAPALIALSASIVTTQRTIDAEQFFDAGVTSNTVLRDDEIITEIRIPTPADGAKSAFMKFAFRKAIDFAVVNCAVLVGTDSPRVALGAVAPSPIRAKKAEALLAGQALDEALAEAAGAAAIADAAPLQDTTYKLQLAKTMVKRALLATLK